MSLERFLRALYAHTPPGFIEVRLIEEKRKDLGRKPEVIERCFYATIADFLADLGRLRHVAEERTAAIFFGVLPRRERGKGKSEDTIDGVVVWADLDFKDYRGGETEARDRLGKFPIPPSIVVRSGHGLHAYWLMREPTDPQELSGLAKRIARVLGGDHTFDAARILRLPESLNRKEPEHPLAVEIEVLDEDRAYNPSEISKALDLVQPEAEEPGPAKGRRRDQGSPGEGPASEGSLGDDEIEIGTALSDRVQALIHTVPRVQNLFWGKGKPPLGRDGRTLDASSSGYDFSLALELCRRGIDDPSEIATALYLRPDEVAKAKGPPYITRTVREAMGLFGALQAASAGEREEPPPDPASQIDFVVEKVRILASDPARYDVTIAGKAMQLTSGQLKSPDRFALRYMDAHKRIPAMPDEGWALLVNDWLAGAEVVEAPSEACVDLAIAEAVEDAVRDLRLKDECQDLHRGGAFLLDEHTAFFRLAPLLKVLKEDYPELTRPQACLALRDLGWRPHRHIDEGQDIRGWAGPATSVRCARESAPEEDK